MPLLLLPAGIFLLNWLCLLVDWEITGTLLGLGFVASFLLAIFGKKRFIGVVAYLLLMAIFGLLWFGVAYMRGLGRGFNTGGGHL